MDGQVIAVLYPTKGGGKQPHYLGPHKRFLDVIPRRRTTLSAMGTRYQSEPRPKATVQMNPDELRDLRDASVEDERPNRRTTPGLAPVQWRRPATVVRPPPRTWVIIVALACAGMLSLALALLVAR